MSCDLLQAHSAEHNVFLYLEYDCVDGVPSRPADKVEGNGVGIFSHNHENIRWT